MIGTEISFDDFIEEYKDENNNGGTVELVDLITSEVTEISEEDFKDIIKV